MSRPSRAEEIRASMQQIRCNLDHDWTAMIQNARTMVDWRHYVKSHPWACVAAAAAVGFMLVPGRAGRSRAAAGAKDSAAGHVRQAIAGTSPRESGLVANLLGVLIAAVARSATVYLAGRVERLVGTPRDAASRRPATADDSRAGNERKPSND
jgi:hypothetical protein